MTGNATIFMLALAVAADPPSTPPSRSGERICRGGGQRALGSHIRTRRRCLTTEEWQREDEARSRPAPGMQITEGQNDGRARYSRARISGR
jgi:hypothetical protein